jgi:oleate hydratase
MPLDLTNRYLSIFHSRTKMGDRNRDPNDTQAWLIGSGIASLAAAVHLIRDPLLPAQIIHILDRHTATGGGIKSSGNAEKGYVLHTGCLP